MQPAEPGRGIATALGEAGATVYCTGRSVPGSPGMKNRPETIDETAAIVTARGGDGIAIRVDHTIPGETHIITSYYGLPRVRPGGLVIEITDGNAYFYRGHFFYDLVKTTVIRMAFALSQELADRAIPVVAVTPGFLRSEWMLDHFGVTEANWRDAAETVKEFSASETPLFVGRCVAALAADPNVAAKNGRVFASWDLAEEYRVNDADGTRPHFVRWLHEHKPEVAAGWNKADDGFYAYWGRMPSGIPG